MTGRGHKLVISVNMAQLILKSNSKNETIRFGKRLAKALKPGSVIAFVGNLGSGKTTWIQGLASGLGVEQSHVKSPTFVVFHIYKGKYPVYHFDLYRLEDSSELDAIGFDEFVGDVNSVSFIEWADRAKKELPKDCLTIKLADKGDNLREFRLSAGGPESKKILEQFKK